MKTKHFIFSLLALSLTCLPTACGGDSDSDSVIDEKEEEKEEEKEDEKGVVKLTSANLTEDGYFDGVMYYKITSNSPLEVCVAKAEKSAVNIVIPSNVSIDGRIHKCTSIGKKAFSQCTYLTTVSIPNSIEIIRDAAFYDCIALTSINIPSSVSSIGKEVFYNCHGKLTINCNIPDTSSDNFPPFYKSLFSEIIIGNDVTSIGSNAFIGCTNLSSLTIGNSVTSIGDRAFANCSKLTSIAIPNSVTNIGKSTFYGCI